MICACYRTLTAGSKNMPNKRSKVKGKHNKAAATPVAHEQGEGEGQGEGEEDMIGRFST